MQRAEHFARGTRLVWVVDPAARTVAVYTPADPQHPVTLGAADTLTGGDVLPGFALDLASPFALLDHGPSAAPATARGAVRMNLAQKPYAGAVIPSYDAGMAGASESITLSLPRSAVGDVLSMSDALTDRMHALLERNADGALSAIEREELETLTRMAQFGQLIALASRSQPERPAGCAP